MESLILFVVCLNNIYNSNYHIFYFNKEERKEILDNYILFRNYSYNLINRFIILLWVFSS